MPELPEVEVTMLGIRKALLDRTIKKVILGDKPLRAPLDPALYNLEGAKVLQLGRRAKYIMVHTDKGGLILHLGMSGHLRVLPKETALQKHDHFALINDLEEEIILNDARRFGLVVYVPEGQDPNELPFIKKLGPEPFDDSFNAQYLYSRLKGSSSAVKKLLMDNSIVVGVGNIYASEVLFASGISPKRCGNTISLEECSLITKHIRSILKAAVRSGGTTVRDFSGADGRPGYFALKLKVYGRRGEPCPVCNSPIVSATIGMRNSFYCPKCQK